MTAAFLTLQGSCFAATNHIDLKIAKTDEARYPKTEKPYIFKDVELKVGETAWQEGKLKTRGQSCLGAPRRCFKVEGTQKVSFTNKDKTWKVKKFNLVSMWQDHGYINHVIGLGLSKKIGLKSYNYQFSTVSINGKPNGLYLVVQRPSKTLKNSPWFGRRRSVGSIEAKKYREDKAAGIKENRFETAYYEMYDILNDRKFKKRKDAYSFFKSRMDIDSYFRLLALHSLVKNGDYTDELFFYAVNPAKTGGKIYFKILPWDFEDLFAPPHDMHTGENGKWRNKKYFKRTILYSFEDPLDQGLAMNKYFYKSFVPKAKEVLNVKITDKVIDEVVDDIKAKITPYLRKTEFLKMSRLDEGSDEKEYTAEYVLKLLEKRRREMKANRRNLLGRL